MKCIIQRKVNQAVSRWEKTTLSVELLLLLFVSAFMQVQCRHDGLNVSNLKQVCFDTQIAPIFINNCGSCHSASRSKGGFSFVDYNSILQSVTPYNAEKSTAYQAITGKAFKQLMPPGIPLSENDRILIRVWIDQGALNTTCTATGGNGNTGGTTGGTTPPSGGSGNPVCFQRDILPVLLSSCGTTGCHNQTSAREGYVITSYASVMSNMVVAGSPGSSRLYTAVANNNMPPSSYTKLTTAEKDSIYNWIKDGALNSTCSSSCDTTTVTYSNQITAIMTANCISCHSGSSAQKGILLDSYANVKANMDNGNILSAVQGITLQMPPGGQITNCEMRQLEIWKATGETQN